jgi:hypothetical protein
VVGRLRVPKEAMTLIGWKGARGEALTFELMERGRARLHLGDLLAPALANASKDGDTLAAEALRSILFVCTWESANRTNTVPRSVRFHVLEDGEINGALHVAVAPKWIEVWSDSFRLRQLGDARIAAAPYLPSE